MQQPLTIFDKDVGVNFSLDQYLEDNATVTHHICFTNSFHLHKYINKQNMKV
jgi:hypothetical protein